MRARIWLLFLLLCSAAFAGWTLAGIGLLRSEVQLRTTPLRLLRSEADPYLLTPQHWLFEPHKYGDFDLHATVELGEATTVDFLLRQVEPRQVDNVQEPFDGRFATLRLSTTAAGPAWLSREEAMLGNLHAGQLLAPGIPATIWVKARGRMLHANVAGQNLPPFQADDAYGMLTLLMRGGSAVVRQLVVEPTPVLMPQRSQRWYWLLVGLAVGAVQLAFAWSARTSAVAIMLAAAASSWLAWFVANRAQPLPLAFLDELGILQVLMGLLLGTSLLLLPRAARPWLRAGSWLLGLAGGALLVHWGLARIERMPTIAPERAQELRNTFGSHAGNMFAEALGQRVRGPRLVHCVGDSDRNVVLLGGKLLYDSRSSAEADPVEIYLTGSLSTAARARYEVLTLPTPDGYSGQQWQLFSRYFQGFHPKALVFGVPLDEAEPDALTGATRSSPAQLASTIELARAYAAANHCVLVLFCLQGLAAPLRAELERAHSQGLPLVCCAADAPPSVIAAALAAELGPRLQ